MITDIFVIIQWSSLAYKQYFFNGKEKNKPNKKLNMPLMALSAITAFVAYRVISSTLIYYYKKQNKCLKNCIHFEH